MPDYCIIFKVSLWVWITEMAIGMFSHTVLSKTRLMSICFEVKVTQRAEDAHGGVSMRMVRL